VPEPVCPELQTAAQPFENCCISAKAHEATPMNVKEILVEMELGLGFQTAFRINSLFTVKSILFRRVFLNKMCFKVFTFILVKSCI